MTIAEYLLPGWLIALRTERPDTAVSLHAGNSSAVTRMLLDGEADLGFVEGLGIPAGLDGTVIAHDRLVVVAAPATPGPAAAPAGSRPNWRAPGWCCASRVPGPGRSSTPPSPTTAAWRPRCSNSPPRRPSKPPPSAA